MIRGILPWLVCLGATLWPGGTKAAPIIPGFTVTTYANAPNPVRLSFDPSGVLYVGNSDNSLSGAFISRVGVGGSAVTPYGPAIFDPDAVLFDSTGVISGIPGAVLVGGSSLV